MKLNQIPKSELELFAHLAEKFFKTVNNSCEDTKGKKNLNHELKEQLNDNLHFKIPSFLYFGNLIIQ